MTMILTCSVALVALALQDAGNFLAQGQIPVILASIDMIPTETRKSFVEGS